MIILKKIARQEGIEVDELDVETRIKEKASEFGTTVEELRSQLEKGGGRDRLHNMLVAERTLEYLLETV
jgi:FKBP-type peptidyl-prolyl cis-trans isomerase (trigger factor)